MRVTAKKKITSVNKTRVHGPVILHERIQTDLPVFIKFFPNADSHITGYVYFNTGKGTNFPMMPDNPLIITAGIITISAAITVDATAHEDKNLCYSYAHKIADKLIKR